MRKDLLEALDRVRAWRKMATLNATVAFCNKRRGSLAKLVFAAASLIVIVSAVAQEFRYNFNDQPYPEANVIVISHKLVPRESSQWFLENIVRLEPLIINLLLFLQGVFVFFFFLINYISNGQLRLFILIAGF